MNHALTDCVTEEDQKMVKITIFMKLKLRFYVALPMKNRSKDSMLEAMNKLIKP